MRIALLDAGLAYKGGHHFEHGRKLIRAFAAAGHEVRAYGFAGMTDDVAGELAELCPVTRLFRCWHYEAPAEDDELGLFNRHSPRIAEDLCKVEPADIWVWPTLGAAELHACARTGVAVPVAGSLHEDPGIAARTTGAMLWRVALVAAHERGLRLTLGSVEPELAARFAELVPDGRCTVLPHPYDGPPPAAARTALGRIGIFGQQRGEKGWDGMRELLERLTGDGYQVLFHDSNLLNPALDLPGVEGLRYVDDMAAQIARCDLVVLPYEVEAYRGKGSGILAECLALGVPVAGPRGTLPGNTIERFGAGPLFDAPTPDAIGAAVAQAARDYPRHADGAFAAAQQFAAHHGTARYAAALLAGA